LKIDRLVMDVDSDSLADDLLFLTPSHSEGYKKIKLTNSVILYYRYLGQYVFFSIVLSFESQGAHAPKSLPKLFYWHESMLEVWDSQNDESDDEFI
jgi:hypothetical protein